MITHRQVEAFRAVILAGSATGAAQLMSLTQPAVTRLIQDIEYRLQLTLFERRGGKLVPTSDAITLYREVERSFQGLERIERQAADLRERRVGRLRIAGLPALAVDFLPAFAARFLAARPTLEITVLGPTSPLALDWVSSGQCDLAVVHEQFQSTAVRTTPLPAFAAVVALPRSHPLAAKHEIHATDLHEQDFITLAAPSLIEHTISSVFAAHRVRPRLRVESPLTMMACRMAAEGIGCTLVDPFTADHYAGERLVVRPFRPAILFEWAIITPSFTPVAPLAEEFMAGFIAEFAARIAVNRTG